MTGRIVAQERPPLRLLGGSAPSGGKPSKLAALAAARKKKEAEAKENASSANTTSLLDRLGSKALPQPTTGQDPQLLTSVTNTERSYPIRKRKSPSPPPDAERRRPSSPREQFPPELAKFQENHRSDPSIFARAMCGGRRSGPSLPSNFTHDLQSTLYGSHDHTEANPFAGPSPDDVVTQAQAKGLKGTTAS